MLNNAQPDPVQTAVIVGVLVALLFGVLVFPRLRRRRALRTYCLNCEAPFEGVATTNVAGFREMTCPSCGVSQAYPMTKAMVVTYGTVLVLACGALVAWVVNHPGEWPPLGGAWVVAVPFILVANHRISVRLQSIAASVPEPFEPMRAVPARRQ
jgi:hypothetical protein